MKEAKQKGKCINIHKLNLNSSLNILFIEKWISLRGCCRLAYSRNHLQSWGSFENKKFISARSISKDGLESTSATS